MVPQDGRRIVDPRKRDLSSARDMAVRIRRVIRGWTEKSYHGEGRCPLPDFVNETVTGISGLLEASAWDEGEEVADWAVEEGSAEEWTAGDGWGDPEVG
jgi:hypothetical protein